MFLKTKRQPALNMGFRGFHFLQNENKITFVGNNLMLTLPRSKNSIFN